MNHATNGAARAPCVPEGDVRPAELAQYLISRGLAAHCERSQQLLHDLLELAMRHADQRVTMERAARMLASSRRSLARRCQKAGIPGPARILAFGRLLQAVRLMRRTGWSLERSAAAQGWPDPFTLSNAMLRTTGLRPTQARQFGPVYLAEAWLRRELETGGAKLHAPLPPHCPACGQEVRVTQGG